jgi:hypothetical protein
MEGTNGKSVDNLKKKGIGFRNKDILIFAFFLFLSFVFWYLNSLSKVIEADIRYPYKYINIPKERSVIEEPSTRLNIVLKGQGFSIMKLKLSNNRAILQIDLAKTNYRRVPASRNSNFYILTTALTKSLTNQIKSGCEVTSVKPDTLFFSFEKINSKNSTFTPDNKGFDNN